MCKAYFLIFKMYTKKDLSKPASIPEICDENARTTTREAPHETS